MGKVYKNTKFKEYPYTIRPSTYFN